MSLKKMIIIGCFTGSVLVAAVTASNTAAQWKEDFQFDGKAAGKILPKGWELKSKIGTPAAEFYLVKDDKENLTYLHMESDKASASVICSPEKIKLKETPILKWRWRVNALPAGGDGREEKKDDQAIGIYIGTGSLLSKKSVSYRWDTETPKGAEGNCSYGAGTIRIKWFTLKSSPLKG